MIKQPKFFTLDLWCEMWAGLGKLTKSPKVVQPTFLWFRLREKYQQSNRYFHNFDHIDFCAAQWLKVRDSFCQEDSEWAGLLAIALHDLVYDSHRIDNEYLSGEAVRQFWADAGLKESKWLDWVIQTIKDTSHKDPADNSDARIVCDIDLSTLAVDWPTFIRNGILIRHEYPQFTETEYWHGRRNFFETYLSRPKIYQSDQLRHLEFAARRNMSCMLELINSKFPP